MTYEFLKVERRGKVGWVIFNRPEALNAMNSGMREELGRAWRELDDDPEVYVIVNTGEGRAFAVGADIREIATDGQGMQRYRKSMEEWDEGFTSWTWEVGKPVIAAINGLCYGGGFHFLVDADLVIASTDATFCDPHVSVGQVSAVETIGLLRKIPAEAVFRLAFLGKHYVMDVQRAYELGMVGEIVEPERLRDAAQELAEKIASNSPAAIRATKKALWGGFEMGLTDACKSGARHLTGLWGHPDQDEGPKAFGEKREPQWLPPVPEVRE